MSRAGVFKEVRYKHPKTGGEKKGELDAVWQYLVDHGRIGKNNVMRIELYTRSKEEFMWRVKARMKGVYRHDQEELKSEFDAFDKEYLSWKHQQVMNQLYDKRVEQIRKQGSFSEKVLLKIYDGLKKYLRVRHRDLTKST